MNNTKPKVVISAAISAETYQKGKESGIKWSHLIEQGLKFSEVQQKFNYVMMKYDELEKKQQRTAELLGKYAAGDSNVLE